MDIGSATHVGRQRTRNEDSLLVSRGDEQEGRDTLCAVADGMGGHAAGDVASRMAIQALERSYFDAPGGDPRVSIEHAVKRANAEIWASARSDAALKGMGTTLVCSAIRGQQATVANIGDSQAYLVEQGTIRQVTRDHSWVAEQMEQGRLSRQEAELHPYRNVLTRALGTEPEVDVDVYEVGLTRGKALILCSEGLSKHVRPAEIPGLVESGSAQAAAERLVELANQRGGSDNTTVVVIKAD